MKRSEMRDILLEKLINKWDFPFGEYLGGYEKNSQEFGKDILDILEEAGMLPPKKQLTKQETMSFMMHKANPVMVEKYKHSWEPEENK